MEGSKLNTVAFDKVEYQKEYEAIGDNSFTNDSDKNKNRDVQNNKHERNSEIEIYGYMTLNDVAAKYNIPINELARCIHIPERNSNMKLGRLMKQYNFQLSELRDYINQKK